MIYSMPIKDFPKEGQYHECTSYKDENDFEWKIAVVKNGFIQAYFGDPYFKDTNFSINPNKKHVLIKNTGCFFWKTKSLEVFAEIRNTLNNGFTDDIWETISECLEERLENDPGILECEIVNRN